MKRQPGFFTRRPRAATLLAALTAVYLVLLIPDSAPPAPRLPNHQPFVWNQDEYWVELESRFNLARETSCDQLRAGIDSGIASVNRLLDSISAQTLLPGAPSLNRLEMSMFELGPQMGACPQHLAQYLALSNRLRRIIKDQSRQWDINSTQARSRIYRLIYGSRMAIEEVMLQAPESLVTALTVADNEPSQTPSAVVLGATVHSGDILLSRGGAPTSALIARGNDYPGNFSHVALVYVDDSTRVPSVIESHIERGVTVSTLDQYLRDTKLRVMVLRLRADLPAIITDPSLPHKAAVYMLRRARSGHIPYNFEMNSHDSTRLFCSAVASNAYSKFGVNLWMGLSSISTPGIASWLAAFGVKYFETQEPSDLEYDPQLRVVAEWRDPQTLYKDHLDNAVTDVMLEGSESGERLEYNLYMLPFARVTKAYCAVLNLFDIEGPIPEGMNATAALRNKWYTARHGLIKERLIKLADQFYSEHGYHAPYWELVRLAHQAKGEVY
jgi:hypothetical protein